MRTRFATGDTGQTLVEMALVLPIVLFLVFGVFELGRVVFIFSALNNASREAARFGAATGITSRNEPAYLDCAAIREKARETAFLAGLADADVDITYDTPDTNSGDMVFLGDCDDPNLDASEINQGDRIVVSISRQIDPILSFLPFPRFNPTFVTARTILTGIVIGPVECSDGLDNDGDGLADYADPFTVGVNDPGCDGPNDTAEAECYNLSVTTLPTNVGNTSILRETNCVDKYIERTLVPLDASMDIRHDPFSEFYSDTERYTFDHWEGLGGPPYPDANPLTLTMDGNKDITAVFRLMTADLEVTKTASPEIVNSGETITYVVTVTNNGSSRDTAHNVVVEDTLPAEVTFLTAPDCSLDGTIVRCELATLAPGDTETFTIRVQAPIVSYADLPLTNAVQVSAYEDDPPDPPDNTASAMVTVRPVADLNVLKSGPDAVEAEQQFTYSITVDNWGPSTATNVRVTDVLPAQVSFVAPIDGSCSAPVGVPGATVTCLLGEMARDATQTVTFQVVAEGSADDLAENQATATATEYDDDLGNNNSENTAAYQETTVYSADVALNKRPNTATTRRDQTFVYYLDVGNAGPSSAPSVVVTDQLPPGMDYQRFEVSNLALSGTTCSPPGTDRIITCQLGELAAGTTGTIRIYVTPLVETGSEPLTNLASIQSARVDYNTGNNSDQVTTSVQAIAGLSIDKTGPTAINHGETLTYRVTVTNATGYSTATNVRVADTLPAGQFTFLGTESVAGSWSCTDPASQQIVCTLNSDLIAGQTASFDVVLRPEEVGDFTNSVTVTSNEQPSGVHATSDDHTTTVRPVLSITKSASAATVNEGDSFAYTIAVANNGTFDATGVEVVDSLPAGIRGVSAVAPPGWTCSDPSDPATTTISCRPDNGTLPAGGNATLTINVVADAVGTYTNTATLNSVEEDHTSDPIATVVNPTFDVSLGITPPTAAAANTSFDYVLTVTNSGPSDASPVIVTSALDPEVTFENASVTSGAGWTCNYNLSSHSLVCTVEVMPESQATFTISVTPGNVTTVTLDGAVTAEFDSDPTNNSDSIVLTLQ